MVSLITMSFRRSGALDPYGQFGDPPYEIVGVTLHGTDDLDRMEPLHDLFPQHPQLHFRKPIAHTAVYAETERDVCARIRPVDDQLVGIVEDGFVAIAR